MNSDDIDIIERIFSDAHIVDIDMSQWDKFIALWVFADHYRDWSGECPLVVVTFQKPQFCSFQFAQLDWELEPSEHIQWNAHTIELAKHKAGYQASISGMPSSPKIVIEFGSAQIREVPGELLDELQPNWSLPYSPLARRGIEEIVKRFRIKYPEQ